MNLPVHDLAAVHRAPGHMHADVELAAAYGAGEPGGEDGKRRVAAVACRKGLELGRLDVDMPAATEAIAPQIQVSGQGRSDRRRRPGIFAHGASVA